MTQALLVINAGSSSIKFALYTVADGVPTPRYRGQADGLGASIGSLQIRDNEGERLLHEELPESDGHDEALDRALNWLEQRLEGHELVGAGHRVVHGGPEFSRPVRITHSCLHELERFRELAPLHQPHNLRAIHAVARVRPHLPQVACFDTAVHRQQPRVAQRFALPRQYENKGVLRYGFHGLSYEYIASVLPEHDRRAAEGRTIVAHLGNGASMCALHDGQSVASTMGFTALDGLPMGQRCGNIDPGVILYLLQNEGMDAAGIEDLLYRRSGLLGLSGISADMRQLLESDRQEAAEAVEYYVYRAVREAGSLTAALGGLDAFVFTAGIGENAAPVRAAICERLAWLGITLDPEANARNAGCITTADSQVPVYVIPTNEELMIAQHTLRVLG